MTASPAVKASPQVAINDIGSEEELLAAIDATIKHLDRKSTRLNSVTPESRMPSSA